MRKLCFLVASLMSFQLLAHTHLADSIAQCAKIEDSLKRLVCFDQLATTVQQQTDAVQASASVEPVSSVATTPSVTATSIVNPELSQPLTQSTAKPVLVDVEVADTAPIQKPSAATPSQSVQNNAYQEFGFEHKNQKNKRPEVIQSKVIKVKETPYKLLILTLENGQVWRQSEADRFKVKVGDMVEVSRGAFTSFFLKKQGGSKKVKFKRVK